MATKIVCGHRGRSVPFNETIIPVSHMSEQAQKDLYLMLRTGRDTGGRRRNIYMFSEKFSPAPDKTARLV